MSKCLHKLQHLGCESTLSTRSLFAMTNFCAEIPLQEEISCVDHA